MNFKKYYIESTTAEQQANIDALKDSRGNIVREDDFVYILPDAFERSQQNHVTFKKGVPYFKHPFGRVRAVTNDGKLLLLGTVKIENNKLISPPIFRGMFTGKQAAFKRPDVVKLNPDEVQNITKITIK